MAANKFATMVHRNTNKITLILIYAVLEWTLIILLLLNSLFSYLIIKFAEYFGLKRPCLWCSRVDHFFEPGKNKNMHRDLLCEAHAAEISKLGFCSNHQKLSESQDMCEDCLSSRPEFHSESKKLTLLPWVKELRMLPSDEDKVVENGEVILKCSCCGISLDNHKYSSYILIKPSWDVLQCSEKSNLITEVGCDDHQEENSKMDQNRSDFTTDQCEDERTFENKNENQMLSEVDGSFIVIEAEEASEMEGRQAEKLQEVYEKEEENVVEERRDIVMKDQSIQVSIGEDASIEILPQHLEFFFDCSGHRLVPVELIDSKTEEDQSRCRHDEEDQNNGDCQEVNSESEGNVEVVDKLAEENTRREFEVAAVLFPHRTEKEPKYAVLESMEMEEDENSLVFHAKECHSGTEVFERLAVTAASEDTDDFLAMAALEQEEKHSDFPPVLEEHLQVPVNETDTEVSIGTEIPDLDATDDIQTQDNIFSYECTPEDPSPYSASLHVDDDNHGVKQAQEQSVDLRSISVEFIEHVTINHSSLCAELSSIEEDKVPDTPTSVDSLQSLHKKLLLLEKKDSGAEDSLDGSVASDIEGGDGVVSIDRLKSVLRTERKALQALYCELDEERSASAVAANQTMAMINRLQEEKAQMQMEALQYQRMMEEQSEYDQEALQLLNELMVKREKEKQEVEKELEIYRRKVLEYETKEKMRMLRKSKDGSARSGFSSASYSNAEDSDGLSIDLNQEAKEEDSFYSHQEGSNHNTPVDTVLNLEESLADFEEERLSILEQLKDLEEKLMTLDDEEQKHFEDVRPIENLHEENGEHIKENGHQDGEANGHENGFTKEVNRKYHHERRIIGSKGKSLLPLFDAINDENGNVDHVLLNGNANGFDSNAVQELDMRSLDIENRKLDIEEEVDHLYERLQALEADREFLKHCISSLKKGDKGMDLLQEILQHLRDLRNVEIRARNFSDCPTV